MTTQQPEETDMQWQRLIAVIKAATKTRNVAGIIGLDKITYIDADAFLEAVEGFAEVEELEPERIYFNKMNGTNYE
jgi:glutamine phosphoribosylpyrophosphate amidotransferase